MCEDRNPVRGIRTCEVRIPRSAIRIARHSFLPRIPHPGRDAVDRHRQRAPQLHEVSGGLLFRWVVRRRDLVQHGEASQQFDLQQIDRIDVGVAHVDRSPEHRVVLEQVVVAAHQRARRRPPAATSPAGWRRNPADPAARAVDRSARRSRARPSQAPSAADRCSIGRTATRGTSRGTSRDRPRRASGSPPRPSHDASSSRVCVHANCHGIARSGPIPPAPAAPRRPAADVQRVQLRDRRGGAEVGREARIVVDRLRGTRARRLRRGDPSSRASAGRARAAGASAASSVAVV